MTIISFSGPAGSGKDSCAMAILLSNPLKWKRLSFAQPMYEMMATALNVRVGDILAIKEGKWGEDKKQRLRKTMQHLGTECLRGNWADDVWLENLRTRMGDEYRQGADDFLVTDTRYPNEYEMLKEMGAKMVYVDCPGEFKRARGTAAKHASETSLSPETHEFDLVLWNDRTKTPEVLAREILAIV